MTPDCQKAAQIYTMENHVEKLLAVYNSLAKLNPEEKRNLSPKATG
jgi:regulator of sirC expression with transglutaminase-like and TPR domain